MTDTITLPRSVVEQALKALNASMPHNNDMDQDWPSHIAARRTLRAALEQPDIGITTSVPSGWKLVPVDPADSQIRAAQDTWWHACNCETYWDQIYAAMIAAAPQPPVVEQPQSVTDCHQSQPQVEQEPVAWMTEDGRVATDDLKRSAMASSSKASFNIPLYTHPQNLNCKSTQARLATLWGYVKPQPPRQPLTNEQVKAGLIDSIDFADQRERCAFNIGVRFAERAHKIGGEA